MFFFLFNVFALCDAIRKRLFEIDIKVEMSSMAEIFLSPGLSLFFYVVVIGYLFGDLVRFLSPVSVLFCVRVRGGKRS